MDADNFYHNLLIAYKSELTDFYSPYFADKDDLESFVAIAFNYDKENDKARFMIQQIERFVSLADDIASVRPGRDSLRMLFFRICMESLCEISEKKKNNFFDDFALCFSGEGKTYILNNFRFTGIDIPKSLCEDERLLFDMHESYDITISDFFRVIKAARDNIVHDGDYWTMQFFAYDNDSTRLVDFTTGEKIISCQSSGEKLTYHFETAMKYERFKFYFVEACINYVMDYMKAHI